MIPRIGPETVDSNYRRPDDLGQVRSLVRISWYVFVEIARLSGPEYWHKAIVGKYSDWSQDFEVTVPVQIAQLV